MIETEELAHYHSIISIVVHRVIDTSDDEIIQMGADTIKSLPAYFESLAYQIPRNHRTPTQQRAFEALWSLSGDNCRPLVGDSTDSIWTWYGYMNREEIAFARDALREIHDYAEIGGEGSADRALFLAWAREATRTGKDLFFYAT